MLKEKTIQQIKDKIRMAKGHNFAKKLMFYMLDCSKNLTKQIIISFPESITLFIDRKILLYAVRFFQNSNSSTGGIYLYDDLKPLGNLFFNAEFETFHPGYSGESRIIHQDGSGYTFVLTETGFCGERVLNQKVGLLLLQPNIIKILNTELA